MPTCLRRCKLGAHRLSGKNVARMKNQGAASQTEVPEIMTTIPPMLRWFLVVLLLASSNGLADEASRKDPIDDHMRSAIDRDPSTAGMVRAYSDASVQWDKRMNSAYRSLKKQMSPDEWQSLVAAQKAWVAYRDAQVKSLELTYSRMDGSMWVPVSAASVLTITRDRALFLESLVETLSER
jgi:uncharacterized protein YecT (DUF1311 family)